MNYSLIISSFAGIKDYSQTVTTVQYKTNREGNPSTLEFTVLKTQEANFHEGDYVRFSVDGIVIFVGVVFTKSRARLGEIKVKCHDQLRYLKAKGNYLFEGRSAEEIIKLLAARYSSAAHPISVGELVETGYKIPYMIENNHEALGVMKRAVEIASYETNRRFVLYDDAGSISLRDTAEWKQSIVLGDKSYVYDFEYTTDIDTDTYNQVKLVRPNKETGMGEAFVYRNPEYIKRWGLLEYFEEVDDILNEAQIDERAQLLLTYYARVLRKVKIECIGKVGIRAGQMVTIYIPDIGDISINHFLTINECVHTFEQNNHTMTLELYVYLDNEGELFEL